MNDFLAVGSYPRLKESDSRWIDAYRKKNDIYYDLIDAHFSFVFPVYDMDTVDFIIEVRKQAEGFHKINFKIKCAIRNNDRTNEYWHVLLVPDDGFSDIVKVHDKLYSGLLSPSERLDLDFIPHIGIGNSTDPEGCKRMVDKVNRMDLNIIGSINQLEVVQHKSGKIKTIETIPLI
jgi:hypothetical protein